MKITGNTVLITGGTSGIGLELARQLLTLDNTVIITGRNQERLERAKAELGKVHIIQSDVSDPDSIRALHQKVTQEFPTLNILINNAGIMRKLNLHEKTEDIEDVTREIETNLSGCIWMVQQFLPHLKNQESAAIVNVTSGLAFVPLPISPVYCATKAALHSFTQSLRIQLKQTNIKVFELAPPGTDTPLFSGEFDEADVKGFSPMKVDVMVQRAITGMKKDELEIRPGPSNMLKLMSRIAPNFIVNMMGKSVERMVE